MANVTYTFQAGTKAQAAQVNKNFQDCINAINLNTSSIETLDAQVDSLGLTTANKNGSSSERFSVANPVNNQDAIPISFFVGHITWCAFDSVPYSCLVCDGSEISRTTYSRLFNKIGTAFGEGDGSTTFNLPDLIDKFIQGNTTVGTYKEAGLPNITGSFSYDGGGTGDGTGCFTAVGGRGFIHTNEQQDRIPTRTFDASRSSSIYGNSTTVQPPALTLLPCIIY